MPLISCIECGQSVSTLAAACPKCGAPVAASASPAAGRPAPVSWKRLAGIALGTFAIGAALFILVLTNVHEPKTAMYYAQTQPASAVPAAPKHHYVAIVRGYFGYRVGLFDNDQANGLASTPLTLVGYQGKRGNEYTFSVSEGGPYVELVTCSEPCEIAQTMGMGGSKVFQVQPGTLLGDIIEDARNGELDARPMSPTATN